MNESEMMKELAKIQNEFDAREHKGNANVYLAGSWFTPNSIKLLVKAYRALAKNPYVGAIYLMPAQGMSTWADVGDLSNIDLDNIETRPYKGQLI